MDTAALEREVAELKETLRETEEICRAIKLGQVDAVVIDGHDQSKRVLLMSGAYARYRQLVEDMAQGAITLSDNGEILFANHSFAELVGERVIDLFRSPLQRHVAAADRGKVGSLLSPRAGQRDVELTSDDFVTLIVTRLERVDGDDEARATLDAIRGGAVDAFVVGGKQVMMLDGEPGPYRELVEHMRQGAVTIGDDGLIVYANERFVSTIGMPRGGIIGKPLAELIAERDRQTLATMLSSNEGAQAELRLRCNNGERPVMQATMHTTDRQKLFLFSDLTLQKRHEASDERTRTFLGMLAHEFRNILAPIGTSTQILKRQALDADGQKALEALERQTARLLALVEDLRRINPKQ
jgi:PAS domain S-box-containing protein